MQQEILNKAFENLEEVVSALEEMVFHHCSIHGAKSGVASMGNKSNANAIRALAKIGMIELGQNFGDITAMGEWKE